MGTPGFCLGSTDWQSQLAAVAPGASANFFNTFMKVWDDVTPLIGFVFCLGDRPGSWVVSDTYGSSSQLYDSYQGLTYLRNLFIASEDAEEWGTVGLYMTLPCPSADDPTAFTELKTGFAFNKCDSGVNFMLSISPNTMACYAEKFSPPVGKLVAMMPEFSFGISVDRKLSRTVLLAHGDGDNIHVSSVTLKAHLGVSVRARISLGKLLSLENAVGDLLAGDLQLQVAAGFDVEEEVKDALTWLTTSDITNSLPCHPSCEFGASPVSRNLHDPGHWIHLPALEKRHRRDLAESVLSTLSSKYDAEDWAGKRSGRCRVSPSRTLLLSLSGLG